MNLDHPTLCGNGADTMSPQHDKTSHIVWLFKLNREISDQIAHPLYIPPTQWEASLTLPFRSSLFIINSCYVKGRTVSRDFLQQVFFLNHLTPQAPENNMGYSGAWGNWFMKKTWSRKSRSTVPLTPPPLSPCLLTVRTSFLPFLSSFLPLFLSRQLLFLIFSPASLSFPDCLKKQISWAEEKPFTSSVVMYRSLVYRGRVQIKTLCMGPYAGVDYNLTLCRLRHMYHGQPMPGSTWTLYGVVDFELWIWPVDKHKFSQPQARICRGLLQEKISRIKNFVYFQAIFT